MNIKVKSINIKSFEKGNKENRVDKSQMTIEQLLSIKKKIAELLDINEMSVVAHYEGTE